MKFTNTNVSLCNQSVKFFKFSIFSTSLLLLPVEALRGSSAKDTVDLLKDCIAVFNDAIRYISKTDINAVNLISKLLRSKS